MGARLVLCLLALASPAAPSADAVPAGLVGAARAQGEGTLRNGTRVPVDGPAAQAFAEGDGALARWRDGGRREPLELLGAFDAWRAAFEVGAPTGAVPASAPAPAAAAPESAPEPPRLFEGRGPALARRVGRLDADERRRWRDHVAPLVDLALARGSADRAALARAANGLPGTLAALAACARLADLELADGRIPAAGGWVRRGREALALCDGLDAHAAAYRAAFDRRAAALARLEPPVGARPLDRALEAGLIARGSVPLIDPLGPAPRVRGVDPGTGLFNGVCALDDGRWCVQSAGRVHLVDPLAAELVGIFEPALLVESTLGAPPFPYPPPAAPGWSFDPATDGRDLLLVEGRSQGRASASNVLLRVAPPTADAPTSIGSVEDVALPRVVWARSAGGHLDPDGALAPLPDLAGTEYQPGPALVGGRCAVQRRRGTGDLEAALVVLDWSGGTVLFEHVLGIGRESVDEAPRGASGRGRSAGSPLAVDGTRVLVVTNLGLVSLVDTLDGSLVWSLRTQRRDPASPRGSRPWTGRHSARTEGAWFAAPADSDHLYALPRGPWPEAAALEAGPSGPQVDAVLPPVARSDARFLGGALESTALESTALDSNALGTLVCGVRAGARECLALLDPARAAVLPGVYLPLGEALCDTIARLGADGRGVVAVGERYLYLFDAARELFLVDQDRLADPLAPRARGRAPALGGPLFTDGRRLGVVSADALLLFAAGDAPR